MPCFFRMFRIVLCQIVEPGSPMLPVSVDNPRTDSPQPCGQPKQQFPGGSEAGPEVGAYGQCGSGQSNFGATSTEFPARRSSPLAPTFSAPAFSLWPPVVVVGHRGERKRPDLIGSDDFQEEDRKGTTVDSVPFNGDTCTGRTGVGPTNHYCRGDRLVYKSVNGADFRLHVFHPPNLTHRIDDLRLCSCSAGVCKEASSSSCRSPSDFAQRGMIAIGMAVAGMRTHVWSRPDNYSQPVSCLNRMEFLKKARTV
jgi:hypothetical protein